MANPVGKGSGPLPQSDKSCPRFRSSEDNRVGAAFRKAVPASDDALGECEMAPSNPQFKDQPPAPDYLSWRKIVHFTRGAAASSASNQSGPVRKGLSTEEKKDKAIESVEIDGLNLRDLQEFRDDDAVVAAAVHNNPNALRFASNRLQGNREILDIANTARNHQLEEARNQLKGVITANGLKLQNYPEFQDDKVFVLWAVKQNPKAHVFASDRLKNDPDILKELK